ncbi:hypothetical protein ScPMuIL_010177 [Solemya velum]
MEKLLKNIYTFANVLVQAHTQAAGSWDERSLQNVLNWASYCQQVHKQVVEKGYTQDFDQQLRSLTLCLTQPSCLELNVEKLGIATKLIKEALLQNPYVSDTIVMELLNTELQRDAQAEGDNWVKECYSLSKAGNILKIAQKMLSVLDPESSKSRSARISQAKLLLECLSRQFVNTSKTERFTAYLVRILDQCVQDEDGMELVLRMLCLETETEETTHGAVHRYILDWLLDAGKDDRLWRVQTDVLVDTAVRHFVFFQHYVRHLTDWANGMQPVYMKTDIGQPYTWRFKDNEPDTDRSYSKLVLRFQELFAADSNTRDALTRLFADLTRDSHFSIWTDLSRTVNSSRLR